MESWQDTFQATISRNGSHQGIPLFRKDNVALLCGDYGRPQEKQGNLCNKRKLELNQGNPLHTGSHGNLLHTGRVEEERNPFLKGLLHNRCHFYYTIYPHIFLSLIQSHTQITSSQMLHLSTTSLICLFQSKV